MYLVLDWFFTLFHTLVTIFNLTGWIFPRLRRLHLIVMGLTAFSWLVLGAFYGWGYCFLTDWHYQVLWERGFTDLPNSYITFLLNRLTGLSWPDDLIISLTGWVFGGIALITLGVHARSRLLQ